MLVDANDTVLVCSKCKSDLLKHKDALICSHCRSRFRVLGTVPIFFEEMNNADVAKEYDYWNKKDNTEEKLYENMPDDTFRKLILDFEIPKKTLGLELGCGDGPFARRLTDLELKIYGLDISVPLLKISKNMQPVQGNALELPFRDQTFDWIIYAFALHHMVELDRALKEAMRVLKKGGKLIVIEPNYYHPVRFLTRTPETFMRKHMFKYLSPEERWVSFGRIKEKFSAGKVDIITVKFMTPKFESTSFIGKIQTLASIIFDFKPLSYLVHSYYMVIGTKTE